MDDKPKHDKLKNDVPRIGRTLFLVLWVAGLAASWIVPLMLSQVGLSLGIYSQSILVYALSLALFTGIPTAFVQKLLVERGLRKNMRSWIRVSVVGWTLSGLAYYLTTVSMSGLYAILPGQVMILLNRMMMVPLFVPVAMVQWFWLRRKVQSAGLWVIAALAGALLFMLPGYMYTGGYVPVMLVYYAVITAAALLYGLATGATMFYLWTRERDKSKNEYLSASQAEN